MNLLERVLTLLRVNINTMVEKADDPEKTLQQFQLDMRNQLVQVKTQVATAIAESHKLKNRSKEKQSEADLWYKKAEQAVQQHNDDAARIALSRYNDSNKQAERYQQMQKEQEQLVLTMRGVLRQLESKIAEVDTTIEILVTRRRNALIQQRVFDALSKSGGPKEKERAAKAQDAVIEAEARARALADLHNRDFDIQLEQIEGEQSLEQQLHDLKKRTQQTPKTPLLQQGNMQPSGLIPPQPSLNTPVKKKAEKKQEKTDVSQPVSPRPRELDLEQLKKLLEH